MFLWVYVLATMKPATMSSKFEWRLYNCMDFIGAVTLRGTNVPVLSAM